MPSQAPSTSSWPGKVGHTVWKIVRAVELSSGEERLIAPVKSTSLLREVEIAQAISGAGR